MSPQLCRLVATSMADRVIVDASAMVDLLTGSPVSQAVRDRLHAQELHAPAHFDAEVLSALGRLQRGGHLSPGQVEERIDRLATAPIDRHTLPPLLAGAWSLRQNLRLVDALYVELARQLEVAIATTDAGLAGASPFAELLAPRL
ncbi:MAG TPA: type II toxin-antitoxin system VapC family toxin [Acidimicrobiales bacterium]